MTKSALVEKIAEKVSQDIGITKRQTEVVVETVFESIKETLAKGEKIEIRGFGNFKLRSRRARQARNPKSGESVEVPAKKVPYFKVGKELREMINKG